MFKRNMAAISYKNMINSGLWKMLIQQMMKFVTFLQKIVPQIGVSKKYRKNIEGTVKLIKEASSNAESKEK